MVKKSVAIGVGLIILFLAFAFVYNNDAIKSYFTPNTNNIHLLATTSSIGIAGSNAGQSQGGNQPKSLSVISCTPSGGYDTCDESDYDYGDAHAVVRLYTTNIKGTYKSGYYVGEAYINVKIDAGKLYYTTGVSSWDNFWDGVARCGDDGCSGSQVSNTYKYSLATAGQSYTGCPVFYAWNKVTASNGDWAWTSIGRGYIGATCNLNVKVVSCYDNADCSSSQYCDKSSTDWKQWSCKQKECDAGNEKCVGLDSYTCSNYKWVLAGKVINKCGVQCLNDTVEKCTGSVYNLCTSYMFANKGIVKGKCGVQCLLNVDCSDLTYETTPVCSGNALVKTVNTGVCDASQGYKCSTQPTQQVVKNCLLTCSSSENLCFESTSTFKYILIGSIAGIIILVIGIIFFLRRKKRRR